MKVIVKHAGQIHPVELDSSQPVSAFKNVIFFATGVPIDRMKVMIKSILLKDDSDLSKMAIKPVIGTSGPLPAPPTQPTLFHPDARLATSLKSLYSGLAHTTDAIPPFALLNNLRVLAPQFAEQDNHGHFSQQASGILDVRFYWRRDIQKKAKIMRKVKFPLQLDVSEMVGPLHLTSTDSKQVTDELRQQIQPVNSAVKQILKERDDRAKLYRRSAGTLGGVELSEAEIRATEQLKVQEAAGVLHQSIEMSNASAMYELWDSGWTRKESSAPVPSGEEDWYKFDVLSMDGGGEDSVAYILLYR
ncbi:hypothetical protein IAR55_005801 [Kwoniella newhampshirensis]|uniref:ubiquitinyl hydrolase 1 n=1 Tax=Kwoniella newhampshirensis TaxID=1651941 RepID=A0AAW0YHC0_9TREE